MNTLGKSRKNTHILSNKQMNNHNVKDDESIHWARCKLVLACLLVLLFMLSYAFLSAWAFTGVSLYHTHHDEVQAQYWRNRAAFFGRACENNTARFVVLDCNETLNAVQKDHLNETLARTIAQLITEQPAAGLLLHGVLGCNEPDSTCMRFAYFCLNLMTEYKLLVMILLWWFPISLSILVWLCQRGPIHYKQRLRYLSPASIAARQFVASAFAPEVHELEPQTSSYPSELFQDFGLYDNKPIVEQDSSSSTSNSNGLYSRPRSRSPKDGSV